MVNTAMDCERWRLQLMALLDGEAPAGPDPHPDARQHLVSCTSCRRWLQGLESMDGRFQHLSYPGGSPDLWPVVERRLHRPDGRLPASYWLWVVAALVIGWRALQLLADVPFPALHPLVPLAGALAALRLVASNPLAIETFAPELQKRGV
jgi:hypothetical protein